jgi:hypothetical protein
MSGPIFLPISWGCAWAVNAPFTPDPVRNAGLGFSANSVTTFRNADFRSKLLTTYEIMAILRVVTGKSPVLQKVITMLRGQAATYQHVHNKKLNRGSLSIVVTKWPLFAKEPVKSHLAVRAPRERARLCHSMS